MRDGDLARILRLADEPAVPSLFVDSLWEELAETWEGVDALDGHTDADVAEHTVAEGPSTRPGRLRPVGPALAAAVVAGVVAVAGLLFLLVENQGANVASRQVDVQQACEQFRADAPGVPALRAGAETSQEDLSRIVAAIGVLAIDLESTGEVSFESIQSLRAAAGGLRQASTRLAEGDPAAAQVNIAFALLALDEADAAPAMSSCFIYAGGQTP